MKVTIDLIREKEIKKLCRRYRIKLDFELQPPKVTRENPGDSIAYDRLGYDLHLNGKLIALIWGSVPGTDRDERSPKDSPTRKIYFNNDEDDEDEDEDADADKEEEEEVPLVKKPLFGEPFQSDPTLVTTPERFIVWSSLSSNPDSPSFLCEGATLDLATQSAIYLISDIILNLKSYYLYWG